MQNHLETKWKMEWKLGWCRDLVEHPKQGLWDPYERALIGRNRGSWEGPGNDLQLKQLSYETCSVSHEDSTSCWIFHVESTNA